MRKRKRIDADLTELFFTNLIFLVISLDQYVVYLNIFFTDFPRVFFIYLDNDYDGNNDDNGIKTFNRYKPRSLDELATQTKFNKKEIQIIYQGFKQDCPTGMH